MQHPLKTSKSHKKAPNRLLKGARPPHRSLGRLKYLVG